MSAFEDKASQAKDELKESIRVAVKAKFEEAIDDKVYEATHPEAEEEVTEAEEGEESEEEEEGEGEESETDSDEEDEKDED